jgi:ankyrin repeat protein
MVTARDGHVDVIQALLAAKADVNARNNDGWTTLKGAEFRDNLKHKRDASVLFSPAHRRSLLQIAIRPRESAIR